MKWEYKSFKLQMLQNKKRYLIEEKEGKSKADSISDETLFTDVLNDIGNDGWELFTINGDVIGKRCLTS